MAKRIIEFTISAMIGVVFFFILRPVFNQTKKDISNNKVENTSSEIGQLQQKVSDLEIRLQKLDENSRK